MIFPPTFLERQTKPEEMVPLPANFQPGPYDVLCTRGKVAYNHHGNLYFRDLIGEYLSKYKRCTTKLDKSMVVIEIVDEIRKLSPDAGFVKFCKKQDCYVEVGDKKAREKVGHALREHLSCKTNNKDANPSTWKYKSNDNANATQEEEGTPKKIKKPKPPFRQYPTTLNPPKCIPTKLTNNKSNACFEKSQPPPPSPLKEQSSSRQQCYKPTTTLPTKCDKFISSTTGTIKSSAIVEEEEESPQSSSSRDMLPDNCMSGGALSSSTRGGEIPKFDSLGSTCYMIFVEKRPESRSE